MLTDYLKKLIDRQAEKDSDFKSLLSKPNKSLKELAEYVTGEAFKAVKDAPMAGREGAERATGMTKRCSTTLSTTTRKMM